MIRVAMLSHGSTTRSWMNFIHVGTAPALEPSQIPELHSYRISVGRPVVHIHVLLGLHQVFQSIIVQELERAHVVAVWR